MLMGGDCLLEATFPQLYGMRHGGPHLRSTALRRSEADAMQQVPDERLYRVASRWEDYTNYGILQDFRDSVGNVFPLQMDTWYYANAFSPVGIMNLGESGTTEQLGVREWLARQVLAFEEAFSDFVRLRADLVDTHYWHPNLNRRSLARDSPGKRRDDDAQLAPETIITGTIIRFDARATLRGSEGYIGDIWLRNVGALQLGTRRFGPVQQRPAFPPIAPKFAWLHLDIVSLFLPDNQATLAQTRNEWKRLRAEDPTVTVDVREDSPAPPVVTLVDPPPSTPLNNQELYAKNAPRLSQAISTWEKNTDHPFVWEISDH